MIPHFFLLPHIFFDSTMLLTGSSLCLSTMEQRKLLMVSQILHHQKQPVCNFTTGQHAYSSISREGQPQVSRTSAVYRNIHGAASVVTFCRLCLLVTELRENLEHKKFMRTKIAKELSFPKASLLGDEHKGIMKLATHIGVPHNKCIYHKTSKSHLVFCSRCALTPVLQCLYVQALRRKMEVSPSISVIRQFTLNSTRSSVERSMSPSRVVWVLYRTRYWSGCVLRVRMPLQTGMSNNGTADVGCLLI